MAREPSERELQDAAAAVRLLAGRPVVHHAPVGGQMEEGDTFYCDWCHREVSMRETILYGGGAYWCATRAQAKALPEPTTGCWEELEEAEWRPTGRG